MTKDIDSLDNHEHGHLPLVVILLHYLEEWRQSHGGVYPTKYADKIAFRDLLSSKMRTDTAEGGEENFEEAISSVMKHIVEPTVPDTLRQVFEYQHQSEVGKVRAPSKTSSDFQSQGERTSDFWVIAGAVKEFYEKHGRLPVPGGLPDMKAQSNVYIKLQNLYKDKARSDAKEVLTHVRNTPSGRGIDAAEIELFCTNARFIKLIDGADGGSRTLAQITGKSQWKHTGCYPTL